MGCNFSWPVRLVRPRSLPSADNELFGGRASRKRSSVVRRDSTFFAIVPLGSAHVGAALENPPTPRSGVRGDGRNREEGSLGSSIGGAWVLGSHRGRGPWPCTAGMHGILHMADVSGQGCGTRGPGPLLGIPRAPQRHFRSPKLDTTPTTARFAELPTTRFDDIVSLGSAAVGAALSNSPTPFGVPACGAR